MTQLSRVLIRTIDSVEKRRLCRGRMLLTNGEKPERGEKVMEAKKQGFSLVEVLIVVSVLSLIAAMFTA